MLADTLVRGKNVVSMFMHMKRAHRICYQRKCFVKSKLLTIHCKQKLSTPQYTEVEGAQEKFGKDAKIDSNNRSPAGGGSLLTDHTIKRCFEATPINAGTLRR